MTCPRSQLVALETTPYYHCINRCVRRAFLMGHDTEGRCFDHRKTWLVARIKHLAEIFAIDIAAYAVMSNHYHLVLHIDKARADAWTDVEVCHRWSRLYSGPAELQRFVRGDTLTSVESAFLQDAVHGWRALLCNLSRFMACLNYVITLRANQEDGCTGRFWEGRFKSQALKDDAALVACMAYVDLNPVRAGIAKNLTGSDFTSVQDRIRRTKQKAPTHPIPRLMPFSDTLRECDDAASIPFGYSDYLELVDYTGREKHPKKRGVISTKEPALLKQIGLNAQQWLSLRQEIAKETSMMLHGLEFAQTLSQRIKAHAA